MSENIFIKNVPFSETMDLRELVDYESGRVVSRTLSQRPGVGVTLFAFDKGEREISATISGRCHGDHSGRQNQNHHW